MIDIYLITNLLNGMQYIGQSSDYMKRFAVHCRNYNYGVRTPISVAIHDYGKDNFTVELIAQVPDDEKDYWEEHYTKLYNTHYTQGGYNITWGGKHNPME